MATFEFERRLEGLASQKMQAETRVEELLARVSALDQELAQTNQVSQAVTESLDNTAKQHAEVLATKERQIQSLAQRLSSTELVFTEQMSELTELELEKRELEETNQQLLAEKSQQLESAEFIERELQDKDTSLNELECEFAQLSEQLQLTKIQLTASEKHLAQNEDVQQQQTAEFERKLERKNAEIVTLSGQVAEKEDELIKARGEFEQQAAEKTRLSQIEKRLERELAEKELERQNFVQELQSLRNKQQSSDQALKAAESALATQGVTYDELDAKHRELSSRYQGERLTWQQKYERLEQANIVAEGTVEQKNAENARLESERRTLKQQNERYSKQLDELGDARSETSSEALLQLKLQNQALMESKHELEQQITALKEQQSRAQETWNGENQTLSLLLTSASERETAQGQEIQALKERLNALAEEKDAMRQDIQTKDAQTADRVTLLQQDLAAAVERADAIDAKNTLLVQQLHELNNETSQLSAEDALNQEQNEQLLQTNMELTEQLEQVSEAQNKMLMEHEMLQVRLADTQEQLSHMDGDLVCSLDELSSMKSMLSKQSQEVDDVTAKLSLALQAEQEASDRIAELEQTAAPFDMEKAQSELQQARDVIQSLRSENSRLESDLSEKVTELEAKVTEYRLKFNFAQQQLMAQQAEIE